ncbi:MAG: InlB B-repeat-containing protein, partial [Ilumatobacteraceae bacterium]
MSVDKNLLQVSTIQPRTATANVYKWLVSIVLILVSVSVTQISSEKVVRATALTCAEGGTCVVGDIGPGGGIIFFVSRLNFTSTSSNCNTECKYLEVAPSGWNGGSDPLGNLSVAIPLVGSHSVTIGSIVYDDWFLPSIAQLNQLCRWHRNVLPLLDYLYTSVTIGKNYECPGATLPNTGVGASAAGILGGRYLSSSADSANVFDQDQSLGYIFNNSNQHSRYIRPVRAFSPGLVVTYNSQSGSAVSAGSTTSGGSVSSSPGSPTRAGYSFSGWFAASTGGSAITFPYSHGQTSDFTLYAQWTISTYAVSFNSNGSTGGSVPGPQTKTDGINLTLASNTGSLVKTGYTFGGWNSAANGSGTSYAAGASYEENAAVTLYAQWTANSLTVTYDSQSGSAVSDGSTTSGGTLASLPTTSREGYTFDGWFTAASGGSQVATSSPHGQTADFTLYAQWTISTYAVSFDGNGSTGGSVPGPQTKTDGINLTLASNTGSLVKTGYTFGGWNSAANGSGTSYAAGASYEENAAVTLYAQWTANSLTVTYDSQSGSAVSDGSTTTGGVVTSAPVAPIRTGYVFTGWFAASTGGSAISFPYTHGRTGSFTLYARWSQASLHGISSVSKIGTITTTANLGNTFAVDTESSSVSLRYPANGLPADTVIDIYLVNDLSRARSLIVPAGGFVVSLVVAWLAADGSVPLMASGKPLSMTIANDTIKAGAKTYAIVGGEVTLLGTAAVNGSVTISITEDPEIVIVNPVVVSQPSSSQPSSSQPSSSQP